MTRLRALSLIFIIGVSIFEFMFLSRVLVYFWSAHDPSVWSWRTPCVTLGVGLPLPFLTGVPLCDGLPWLTLSSLWVDPFSLIFWLIQGTHLQPIGFFELTLSICLGPSVVIPHIRRCSRRFVRIHVFAAAVVNDEINDCPRSAKLFMLLLIDH